MANLEIHQVTNLTGNALSGDMLLLDCKSRSGADSWFTRSAPVSSLYNAVSAGMGMGGVNDSLSEHAAAIADHEGRLVVLEGKQGALNTAAVNCYIAPASAGGGGGDDDNMDAQYASYGTDAQKTKPLKTLTAACKFLSRFRAAAPGISFVINCANGTYFYGAEQSLRHPDCSPTSGCSILVMPAPGQSTEGPVRFDFTNLFKDKSNVEVTAIRTYSPCTITGVQVESGVAGYVATSEMMSDASKNITNVRGVAINSETQGVQIAANCEIRNFSYGVSVFDSSVRVGPLTLKNCYYGVFSSLATVYVPDSTCRLSAISCYNAMMLYGSRMVFNASHPSSKMTLSARVWRSLLTLDKSSNGAASHAQLDMILGAGETIDSYMQNYWEANTVILSAEYTEPVRSDEYTTTYGGYGYAALSCLNGRKDLKNGGNVELSVVRAS